jgi:hypothetical protein
VLLLRQLGRLWVREQREAVELQQRMHHEPDKDGDDGVEQRHAALVVLRQSRLAGGLDGG